MGARRTVVRAVTQEDDVFGWLKRRRLSEAAQRQLRIALARAEEELIETHVENILEVFDALGGELALPQVVGVYLDEIEPGSQRAAIIARRAMAQLQSQPRRRRGPRPEA